METIDKLKDLTGQDWLVVVPLVGTVTLAVYYTVQYLMPKEDKKADTMVNLNIQKESAKVVNMVDVEDIADKVVYCRCWRSKKFPLCDGSHTKHNDQCGDNVGPLIVKHKQPEK